MQRGETQLSPLSAFDLIKTVDNNVMLTKILEEIEKKETVRVKKVETDNDGENSSAGVVSACCKLDRGEN